MIELNKIYNEDCLIGMKNISDKTIDCILTDPSFNTTNCALECEVDLKALLGFNFKLFSRSGTFSIALH